MSSEKQTFGEQAARFSLYAPFLVLGISFLYKGNANLRVPGVAIAVLSLSLLTLSGGFVLGIVALALMRRYGTKHIMGRAIAGVLLNGIALGSSAYFLVPLAAQAQTKKELVGHWRLQPTAARPAQRAEITFSSDGTFQLTGVANGVNSSSDGRWILTKEQIIGLTIEHIGRDSPPENFRKVALGTVKTVDRATMVLGTGAGEESYTRIP